MRPHLEFAVQAWNPWTQQDMKCYKRVQKKAVGMVSGLRETIYEEKVEELGLTTLKER